ncbi:diacylglycerol kinase family protein [Novosphingobium sp. 9]|uniref:diacylglycerol kinase family protein n=1 Tax=Novosphingobium sp. 9 TaxID=2025349 RepID=UPI0021B60DFF|nr:diacylglycerol kinase family protein [Novosphingobium sp. 9]
MIESPDVPARPARFSILSRLRSFVFAWNGLRWLVRSEHNARVHLAASIATAAAGLILQISASDWRWLFLAMALVWLAEAFNTAIEQLCNRIEPGFDPVIGRIKDVSAGAVLVASVAAAGIGLLTLGPPLWAMVSARPFASAMFTQASAEAMQPVRKGEVVTTVALKPYDWRTDPRCLVAGAHYAPELGEMPEEGAIRWRAPHRFAGTLNTNFEGWSFTVSGKEIAGAESADTYWADVRYSGSQIEFAPEPRVYRVTFIGREALCNPQRLGEKSVGGASAPNVVRVDRFSSIERVK